MKLQEQVISLEQAIKLKELGVTQGKSYAAYIRNNCHEERSFYLRAVESEGISNKGYEDWSSGCLVGYDAYTVAELGGDILSDWFEKDNNWELPEPIFEKYSDCLTTAYNPQFLADIAIYLLENNLHTLTPKP